MNEFISGKVGEILISPLMLPRVRDFWTFNWDFADWRSSERNYYLRKRVRNYRKSNFNCINKFDFYARNLQDMRGIKSNDRKMFRFWSLECFLCDKRDFECFFCSFWSRKAGKELEEKAKHTSVCCQRDTRNKSILNNKLNIKTLMSSKSLLILQLMFGREEKKSLLYEQDQRPKRKKEIKSSPEKKLT